MVAMATLWQALLDHEFPEIWNEGVCVWGECGCVGGCVVVGVGVGVRVYAYAYLCVSVCCMFACGYACMLN